MLPYPKAPPWLTLQAAVEPTIVGYRTKLVIVFVSGLLFGMILTDAKLVFSAHLANVVGVGQQMVHCF